MFTATPDAFRIPQPAAAPPRRADAAMEGYGSGMHPLLMEDFIFSMLQLGMAFRMKGIREKSGGNS